MRIIKVQATGDITIRAVGAFPDIVRWTATAGDTVATGETATIGENEGPPLTAYRLSRRERRKAERKK